MTAPTRLTAALDEYRAAMREERRAERAHKVGPHEFRDALEATDGAARRVARICARLWPARK